MSVKKPFELGDRVRCKLSGFEGNITAITTRAYAATSCEVTGVEEGRPAQLEFWEKQLSRAFEQGDGEVDLDTLINYVPTSTTCHIFDSMEGGPDSLAPKRAKQQIEEAYDTNERLDVANGATEHEIAVNKPLTVGPTSNFEDIPDLNPNDPIKTAEVMKPPTGGATFSSSMLQPPPLTDPSPAAEASCVGGCKDGWTGLNRSTDEKHGITFKAMAAMLKQYKTALGHTKYKKLLADFGAVAQRGEGGLKQSDFPAIRERIREALELKKFGHGTAEPEVQDVVAAGTTQGVKKREAMAARQEPEPSFTKEDVKNALQAHSQQWGQARTLEIFGEFECETLEDLPQDGYGLLIQCLGLNKKLSGEPSNELDLGHC